jgi:dihydrolipoamide dehydrogenase
MIGDVRDELPLLHLANFDAKALSKILLSKPLLRQPIDLSIVFTDPQMMRVGLSLKQLQDRAIDFTAAEIDFKNQGRSRMFLVNEGMLRVYFDKSSENLLGAEMCGPDAEHFAHFFALAIKNNETKSSLLELPYYHPTIIESLKSILK